MADLLDEYNALKQSMHDVNINVYDLCDAPDVPAVMVLPDAPFDWHYDFEDSSTLHRFIVWILVAYVDNAAAAPQMMEYLSLTGPNSIPAAIEAVPGFEVKRIQSWGLTVLGDNATRYLSAEIMVQSLSA